MNNIYFIVNKKLTYVSTQFLLEWFGYVPQNTLYATYYQTESDVDEFLMEFVDKGSVIFVIGFSMEKSEHLQSIFSDYTFKIFNSDIDGYECLFDFVLHSFESKIRKLDSSKIKYIKYFKELMTGGFGKESYIVSILFRNLHIDKFYKYYNCGYQNTGEYNPIIAEHIGRFNKQSQTIYEYDGFYFVLSKIVYLEDYNFKYAKTLSNLSIIDLSNKRVYMKNLTKGAKDINNLCKKYCKNIKGFKDFCSGDITDDFLEITKNMKKI